MTKKVKEVLDACEGLTYSEWGEVYNILGRYFSHRIDEEVEKLDVEGLPVPAPQNLEKYLDDHPGWGRSFGA